MMTSETSNPNGLDEHGGRKGGRRMAVALGWSALALAGVVGAPRAERGDAEIGYTVRFVETEGLGWRAAVFTRLAPVTRQGAATVCTAPRGVPQRLLDTALSDRTS